MRRGRFRRPTNMTPTTGCPSGAMATRGSATAAVNLLATRTATVFVKFMSTRSKACGRCCAPPLRPHRGISQELLPLYLGFFEFVHNFRKRGKALLGSLLALLLSSSEKTAIEPCGIRGGEAEKISRPPSPPPSRPLAAPRGNKPCRLSHDGSFPRG